MERRSEKRQAGSRLVAAAAALCFAVPAAQAAQPPDVPGDVIPGGKGNNNYCEIIVTRNGTIAPNVGATVLSSGGAGGLAGSALVTATNSGFSLVAEPPSGFALGPAGSSQDVVFSAAVSGNGATSFLQEPGNVPVRLKRGVTMVDADLTASRLSGTFPAGHYRADLVLRCE